MPYRPTAQPENLTSESLYQRHWDDG